MTMTQKNLQINDYYVCSDLALVTAISLWYPIESIDRHDPRKARFLFKRDDNLNQLIEAYWRGELKVEPQSYFNQLKIIKARLYSSE